MPGGKRYTPRRVSVAKTEQCLEVLNLYAADIAELGDIYISGEVAFAVDTFEEALNKPPCDNNPNQVVVGAISFMRAIVGTMRAGEAIENPAIIQAAELLSASLTRGLTSCEDTV